MKVNKKSMKEYLEFSEEIVDKANNIIELVRANIDKEFFTDDMNKEYDMAWVVRADEWNIHFLTIDPHGDEEVVKWPTYLFEIDSYQDILKTEWAVNLIESRKKRDEREIELKEWARENDISNLKRLAKLYPEEIK